MDEKYDKLKRSNEILDEKYRRLKGRHERLLKNLKQYGDKRGYVFYLMGELEIIERQLADAQNIINLYIGHFNRFKHYYNHASERDKKLEEYEAKRYRSRDVERRDTTSEVGASSDSAGGEILSGDEQSGSNPDGEAGDMGGASPSPKE